MSGRIRDAVASDAIACAAIYAPYVRETAITFETDVPSDVEFERRIDAAQTRHAWLVAEVAGAVAGYAYAHEFAGRAAYGWACEVSVYVDSDRRGSGLGRALYDELLPRLAGRGFRRALAGIAIPNDASVRLHERYGFERVGVYRRIGWKLDSWHDVAWFQRDLGVEVDPPAVPL